MSEKHREGISMRIADIEKIVENKYSLLLFFLISLSVISIITVDNISLHFSIEAVLSLIVFIIMLRILKAPRFLLYSFIILAFLALLLHYLTVFRMHNKLVGVFAMLIYILMIGILIMFMIRRIFSERLLTGDTILLCSSLRA